MDAQSTIVTDGAVWVKEAAIAAITKRGDATPVGFEGIVPLETGGTIFPGLIELHNHVAYNALPLWQVPQKYTNRDTWGNSAEYHRLVTAPIDLDPLTVADDSGFREHVAAEINLPEYMAPGLLALYQS